MSKPIELFWFMKIWSKNVFREKNFLSTFGQRILGQKNIFQRKFGQIYLGKKIFGQKKNSSKEAVQK